jgi:hypothetical protein
MSARGRLVPALLGALVGVFAVLPGAAPALAAEASCAGLPEPERAHEEQLRAENNSTQLPDCRVYELVSPAEKSGGIGDVFAFDSKAQNPRPMQAAGDGEAVSYSGEQFFQALYGGTDQYISTRGSSGWSTVNLTPGDNGEGVGLHEGFVGLAADLSEGLLPTEGYQLSPSAPAGYRNLYLVGHGATVTPLLTEMPPDRSAREFGDYDVAEHRVRPLSFAPAATNLSWVFFAANDALGTINVQARDGRETENNLYRWSDGVLHLVNVLPDGSTEPKAEYGFQYENGEDAGYDTPDLDHAVSADGRRVFWTDENNHNLYLREVYEERGEEEERTVQVDEALGGGGEFLAATPSGSNVYFTKSGQLYEYQVHVNPAENKLVDLTPSPSAEAQGIVGISEDGEYVYFVAHEALTASENAKGEKARKGEDNLFVYQPGPGGTHEMRFIAILSTLDEQPPFSIGNDENVADWAPTVAQRTAEVSPNGHFVAFGSHLPLTDQSVAGEDQIYVYDDETGALSCASCEPTGVTSTPSFISPFFDSYGTYQQRYMLSDGRLFFTTATALVAQDTNGQKDVYEWEGGEVHLISSGTSAGESVFADASEDGRDVFFTTSQPLVPEDHDEIVDLYDAREGGGFPAPASTLACQTIAGCQGVTTTAAPSFTETAGVVGAGNLQPPAPSSPTALRPRSKTLTRAQSLTRSLRACRKRYERRKRARALCERQARRRYGTPAPRRKPDHGRQK